MDENANAAVGSGLRRRVAVVAAILAVAGAAIYLARDVQPHLTLPAYALAVDGGAAELRAGAPFELALRPASSVTDKTVAYAFAIGEGEPNAVDARIVIAKDGTVTITGGARALAGARELRVVVGAPAEFKRYEDALVRAREGKSDANVRVLAVPVTR